MKSILLSIAIMAFPLLMQAGTNQAVAPEQQASGSVLVAPTELSPTEAIQAIREVWRDNNIRVAPSIAAGIEGFSSVFCKQYAQFEPNRKLLEYFANPKVKENVEWGYHVDAYPKTGFISCVFMSQFELSTTCCYWKRNNGHRLIAIAMEEDHENSDDGQRLVVFYDYNPQNRLMTPEPQLTEMVENLVKGHHQYNVVLPNKGKDIMLDAFDFSEDSAMEYQYYLIWDGYSFKPKKPVRP